MLFKYWKGMSEQLQNVDVEENVLSDRLKVTLFKDIKNEWKQYDEIKTEDFNLIIE